VVRGSWFDARNQLFDVRLAGGCSLLEQVRRAGLIPETLELLRRTRSSQEPANTEPRTQNQELRTENRTWNQNLELGTWNLELS